MLLARSGAVHIQDVTEVPAQHLAPCDATLAPTSTPELTG